MTKIFSIDPNDGKYFIDADRLYNPGISTFYQGTYRYTPVFPKYTIDAKRFDFLTCETFIKFYTMIPISKLFHNYLVEVHHEYRIGLESNKSFDAVVLNFNEYCNEMIKNINIKSLKK